MIELAYRYEVLSALCVTVLMIASELLTLKISSCGEHREAASP